MRIKYNIDGLIFENICDIVVQFNEYVVDDYICNENELYVKLVNNDKIIYLEDNLTFIDFTAEQALETYNRIIKIIKGE